MRKRTRIVLVGMCISLLQCSAVDGSSYTYPLEDGSSLTIRSAPDNGPSGYELLYARPDGKTSIVWTTPDNNGSFRLSDVRSTYIANGRISALFNTGASDASIFALEVPEVPGKGVAQTMVLTGLLRAGGLVLNGSSGREELRLTDHTHFEIVDGGAPKQTVLFDPKSGTATVDGKRVETFVYYQGVPVSSPSSPSLPEALRGNPTGAVGSANGSSVAMPAKEGSAQSAALVSQPTKPKLPPSPGNTVPNDDVKRRGWTFVLLVGIILLSIVVLLKLRATRGRKG